MWHLSYIRSCPNPNLAIMAERTNEQAHEFHGGLLPNVFKPLTVTRAVSHVDILQAIVACCMVASIFYYPRLCPWCAYRQCSGNMFYGLGMFSVLLVSWLLTWANLIGHFQDNRDNAKHLIRSASPAICRHAGTIDTTWMRDEICANW